MTRWLLLPLAAAVAVAVSLLAVRSYDAEPRAPSPGEGELAQRVRALSRAADELLGELRAAERASFEARTVPAAGPPLPAAEEIAAAVERYRAAHHEDGGGGAEAGEETAATARPRSEQLANLGMDEIVELLRSPALSEMQRALAFEELRDTGRIGEYVAALEELARERPEDPEIQVLLGQAYLEELFGLSAAPEAGELAMKSDRAFDRALELDPQNWEARFWKAAALSNWPSFLGRTPEAIEHFSVLIEQQEQTHGTEPHFAETYLLLGNLHQRGGDLEEALAVWRRGLALFPDHEELSRQIELAEGEG